MNILIWLLVIFYTTISYGISSAQNGGIGGMQHQYLNMYNPLANGSTCSATTLNAAIASSNSAGKIIYLTAVDANGTPCTWTLAANVTLPTTRTLWITAPIVINSGVTLTLNGNWLSQIGSNWMSGGGTIAGLQASAPNRWSFTGWVNVGDYGPLGTGGDDRATIQAACDVLAARDSGSFVGNESVLFFPSVQYNINSGTVNCNLPSNTAVLWFGTYFKSTADIEMFNFNPDAVASDGNVTSIVLQLKFMGPVWFENTAVTFASSKAIILRRCRDCTIDTARFMGFRYAIEFSGANNYRFKEVWFHNNYYGAWNSPWDTSGAGTIFTVFDNIQGNANSALPRNPQCAICMEGDYYNLEVNGGEYSSGSDGPGLASIYFTNNFTSPRHIQIRSTHFEGGLDGVDHMTTFARHIWFRDTKGNTNGYDNTEVDNCSFAGAAAYAIVAERCDSCTFRNNDFKQTIAGAGKSIDASDPDNARVYLSNTNQYSDALPVVTPTALRCLDKVSDFTDTINIVSGASITLPTFCSEYINVTGTTKVQTIVGGWIGRKECLAFQAGGSLGGVDVGSAGGNADEILAHTGNIQLDDFFLAARTPSYVCLEFRADNLWHETSRNKRARQIQEVTIADSGNGSPATYTIDSAASLISIKCNDADGCTLSIADPGVNGYPEQELTIFNNFTNPLTLADSSNVVNVPGSGITLAQYNTIRLKRMVWTSGNDQWVTIGSFTDAIYTPLAPALVLIPTKTFATLGTPSNGVVYYCSDCAKATPCSGSSSGALAKRLNGAWDCD